MLACRVAALAAGLGATLVGTVAAQSARRTEVSQVVPSGSFVFEMPRTPRVFMGFSISTLHEPEGLRVTGVTPGGPADRAGLRAGDLLVRFNGVRLASSMTGGPPTPDGASPAVLNFITLASRLSEGDTATFQLRRADAVRTVSLLPTRATLHLMESQLQSLDPLGRVAVSGQTGTLASAYRTSPRREPRLPDTIRARTQVYLGSPSYDLQLAPMNPQLGRYFGIDDGVLVISVPDGSAFPLQGGDVVVALDGRRPESPIHLLRILQSYSPGEPIQFDVLRDRRRLRLVAK